MQQNHFPVNFPSNSKSIFDYDEKFDIAVAPEVFQQVEERKRTDDLIYVGFAGSMRFTNNAFN